MNKKTLRNYSAFYRVFGFVVGVGLLVGSTSAFAAGLSQDGGGGSKPAQETCRPTHPLIECSIGTLQGMLTKIENGKQGVNTQGFDDIGIIIQNFVTIVNSNDYTNYLKDNQNDERVFTTATDFKRMVLEGFAPALSVIKNIQSHNYYQDQKYIDKAGTNTYAWGLLSDSLTGSLYKVLRNSDNTGLVNTATQRLAPGEVVLETGCVTDVFVDSLAQFVGVFRPTGPQFQDFLNGKTDTLESFVTDIITPIGNATFQEILHDNKYACRSLGGNGQQ